MLYFQQESSKKYFISALNTFDFKGSPIGYFKDAIHTYKTRGQHPSERAVTLLKQYIYVMTENQYHVTYNAAKVFASALYRANRDEQVLRLYDLSNDYHINPALVMDGYKGVAEWLRHHLGSKSGYNKNAPSLYENKKRPILYWESILKDFVPEAEDFFMKRRAKKQPYFSLAVAEGVVDMYPALVFAYANRFGFQENGSFMRKVEDYLVEAIYQQNIEAEYGVAAAFGTALLRANNNLSKQLYEQHGLSKDKIRDMELQNSEQIVHWMARYFNLSGSNHVRTLIRLIDNLS